MGKSPRDGLFLVRKNGGADRARTCDLLIANETLYQLSYDPNLPAATGFAATHNMRFFAAGTSFFADKKADLATR